MWARLLIWIGTGIGVLVVLAVIGLELILHTNTAHRYILRTAEQKIAQSLGSQVSIGNYALNFHGVSPTVDLYDVVVPGAPSHTEPPLLRIDHIRVVVHVSSLWHQRWDLNEIRVDHPVVYVLTDKLGRTNLPRKQTSTQSSTNIFSLSIRRALLDRGVVYYNNEKSEIEADLHDLRFQSTYNNRPVSYAGTVTYNNGHLKIANYRTINHDFYAQFVATPSQFRITDAVLRSGPSEVLLHAKLNNYSQPRVIGDYQIELSGAQLRRIFKNSSVPTGTINLNGSFRYASTPNKPVLQDVAMDGMLRSKQLEIHTPQFTGPVRDLAADYSLAGGTLHVLNIRAGVLGGQLSGSFTTTDITGAQNSSFHATLDHVSLSVLQSRINNPALKKNVSVTGAANAEIDASWKKNFTDVKTTVLLDFSSNVTPTNANRSTTQNMLAGPFVPERTPAPGNAGSAQAASMSQKEPTDGSISVRGHLQLYYSSKTGQLTVQNGYIRTPQSTLEVNGSLNGPAGLAVNLNHVQLQQLAAVIATFMPAGKKPVLPADLVGVASFRGRVTGTTKSSTIQGALLISNLQINASRWQTLRANVSLSSSKVALTNGALHSATGGSVFFDVSAGLHRWSFTNVSPFRGNVNGSGIRLANLTRAAGTHLPLTGIVSLNVKVHGSEESPAGTGRITVMNATVSGQPITSVNLNLQSDGRVIEANLGVRLPLGIATAAGTFDLANENYTAQAKANGIQLASLQVIKTKKLPLSGIVNLSANGRGNIHNPQLTATVQVPTLTVQDQTMRNLILQANVANHVANVSVSSEALDTSLQGRAQINLTGDYETVASVDTQAIPLTPLVVAYAPTQVGNITGQTEIHAALRGPLKNTAAMNAHISIPKLEVNYKNLVQITAPQAIQVNYANGVLNLQRTALVGTDTNLQLQGRIPLVNRANSMALLVQGTVNLKLAQLINPDLKSSGQVQFDINSFGNRTNPNVEGQVRIINASFATGTLPLGLQNGNGLLTLTRDRLNVTQFQGEVGGGTVSASGGIVYRPAVTFDLAVAARNVRMLYPQGIRSNVGGNLILTGTPQNAYLRGQVRLLQLSFTPDFDAMTLLAEFSGNAPPPPTRGFTDNLQLDFRVLAPHGIDLVSRNLSLQGGLNLNIRGTASDPVVLGRVNLSEGDMIFQGNRYILQGATVDFLNPVRTEPVISASVNTTINQYNIAMRFEGPVEHLRTNYSSDPALPPADIINLLAFGKTTEEGAANTSVPGTLAAESAIASAVSGQVTSRLERIVGISRLSIDPTLGGVAGSSQANPGAVVTIQQRVTGKIFVTFSTDVTSTQRQVIQLEYQVTPQVSVSGTRDQNGGFAFDTQIKKSW